MIKSNVLKLFLFTNIFYKCYEICFSKCLLSYFSTCRNKSNISNTKYFSLRPDRRWVIINPENTTNSQRDRYWVDITSLKKI